MSKLEEKMFPYVGAYVSFRKRMVKSEFVKCPVDVILIYTPALVIRVNRETIALKVPYLDKCDFFTVLISKDKLNLLRLTEEERAPVTLFNPPPPKPEKIVIVPLSEKYICPSPRVGGEEEYEKPDDPNLNDSDLCRLMSRTGLLKRGRRRQTASQASKVVHHD